MRLTKEQTETKYVMESGKKSTAERIVYGALDIVAEKSKEEPIRADVLVRQRAPGRWERAEVKVRHIFKGSGEPALAEGGGK